MMRLMRLVAWSNAALALVASIGVVHAQQAPSQSAAASAQLEEIVVTAARVEESLQKTALAIQAVSPEEITARGAFTPEEIGKLVPSMNIVAGGYSTIYLRGLGANSAGGFGQNSLSFSVDGVVLSQPQAVNGNFFDLERMEVLKGPQGTLYGRNASAGAMNVITQNPGRELGGNVNVEVGNYSLSRVNAGINVPFSDTFAVRGALYATEHDGYNKDGSDDDDQLNGRIKALWTPSDSLSVLLGYSESNVYTRGGTVNQPRPAVNGDPRLGRTDPAVTALLTSLGSPTPSPRAFTDSDNSLAYATVDWNLGFGTLTYIPAYAWGKTCVACANQLIPFPAQDQLGTHIESNQLSNELRLANAGDRFRYVVGLYQFSERINMDNLYYFSADLGSSQQHIEKLDTDSYAAFGEVTLSLTDSFRLIGGLRYTTDEKELAGTTVAAGPTQMFLALLGVPGFTLAPDPLGITGITGLRSTNIDNSADFNKTNWKAGLEYDLSPSSFVYATVSTGFKSGIFYPGPAPNLAQPEKMTAFTLGSKNRFLDNSLQVNVEAFYWKFKDQQVSGVGTDSGGSINFITFNAGESTIYGANLDLQWRITPTDMFSANVEYDHAYYDKYIIPSPLPFSNPDGIGGGCVMSQQPTPGALLGFTFFADCSDKHMVYAPDWSGNVSYGHDFTMGARNTLHAEVSARFNSEQYLQQNWATELSKMPGYVMWDAVLEYSFADKPLSIALWGRNLGDKLVYTSADGANLVGVYLANTQAPRTYGLRVNFSF